MYPAPIESDAVETVCSRWTRPVARISAWDPDIIACDARFRVSRGVQARPVARAAFFAARLSPAPVFRAALFADLRAFVVLDVLRLAFFMIPPFLDSFTWLLSRFVPSPAGYFAVPLQKKTSPRPRWMPSWRSQRDRRLFAAERADQPLFILQAGARTS